uniref:Butyrophilin subfamily 2 member A2 n=1 Tax=Oreochromis niloticus TaxID=8128 RepID=I3K662_ORENI
MYHRVFVVASLLSSYMGGTPAHSQPVQVLAFAGGDVILPCRFNISDKEDFPTVEWSKEGLKPDVVFLYRDGCEAYEMKNPAFEYRTSLIMKALKDGNISLRISNVQVSDTGKYQCLTFQKNVARKVTTVALDVVAVSEPKLSVISAEGSDIALHCEANCWLPEPEVTFLDDNGNNIYGENPKGEQDPRGCFTVTRRATLQRATSSVTCRVHQPEFNQTRETKILIPGVCMKSDPHTIAIAIGGTALFFLVAAGVIALSCKKCFRCAIVKQPVKRKTSNQSHLHPTRVNSTDSSVNGSIGQMKRESGFLIEDETRKLQDSKVVSYSSGTTVQCHSTTTADVSKPSKLLLTHGPDNKSLTSVHNPNLSSASNSFKTPKSDDLPKSWGSKLIIKRQNSFPGPGNQMINSSVSPHQSTHHPQRRRSSGPPHFGEFHNRHSLLRNLPEEDEQRSLLKNEN